MQALCPLSDLPPGASAGFEMGVFAVHAPNGIVVYQNACPHLGVPLDWLPGRFLNQDGTRIVCATHGAEFLIDTGLCVRGPCKGDCLTRVPFSLVNGMLMVPGGAGL
jgi:nitrite reductase/ring-hydroxylating ferredoxin subunit